MDWYKVIMGTRRYTTEKTDMVQANSPEEACRIAIRKHKGMRYAIARREA